MKHVCLAMDVGGTFIKYALAAPDGELLVPAQALPVPARGGAPEILAALRSAIERGAAAAQAQGGRLRKICVAICGPFDYAGGVSLMQEDKYRAIYGVNLRDVFRGALAGADRMPVFFVHDVQAFLMGQAARMPALRQGRVMAVTLGTGIGSAFMENGRIIPPGRGAPDRGLGRLPYRAGKVENYIGGPALVDLYRKSQTAHRDDSPHLSENKLVDKVERGIPAEPGMDHDHADEGGRRRLSVREIAELARRGDAAAGRVFRDLGEILGETLAPILRDFAPARLVFGGRISRAYDLFSGPLLARIARWIAADGIFCAPDAETAALLGAVIASEKSGDNENH